MRGCDAPGKGRTSLGGRPSRGGGRRRQGGRTALFEGVRPLETNTSSTARHCPLPPPSVHGTKMGTPICIGPDRRSDGGALHAEGSGDGCSCPAISSCTHRLFDTLCGEQLFLAVVRIGGERVVLDYLPKT